MEFTLKTLSVDKDLNDIVLAVEYELILIENETIIYQVSGKVPLPAPDGNIIPFEELREENYITWITAILDFPKMKENILELVNHIETTKFETIKL